MNAIMTAVLAGHTAIVNCLLSAINDRSLPILDQVEKRTNRPVFLLAVQTGSIPMCSLLLTHPYIRWDIIDKHRLNIFHIAAQNNHHELLQFLCRHFRKTDQFIPMISRSYSIGTTIERDLTSLSLFLREYLDAQNDDGKTPLHFSL